jgi:hypothetical protein
MCSPLLKQTLTKKPFFTLQLYFHNDNSYPHTITSGLSIGYSIDKNRKQYDLKVFILIARQKYLFILRGYKYLIPNLEALLYLKNIKTS